MASEERGEGRSQETVPAAGDSFSRVDAVMRPLNVVVERFIPSAFVFAVVLTAIVAVAALLVTDAGPKGVLVGWGEGFAGLLEFTMQMVLILLLGHMLAHTRPARRILVRLSGLPRSTGQAYVFVVVLTSIASLISWGLGLVVGALLAKEVARQGRGRGLRLHFPLLVAAGYSGWVVWHMGYSGSASLTAATEDSFAADMTGSVVPMSQTTFSVWNMVGVVVAVVLVATTIYLLRPRTGGRIIEVVTEESDEIYTRGEVSTPAERVDNSRVPTFVVGFPLAVYIVVHFVDGGALTLDIVNWTFMCAILLLVRNSNELIALIRNSARNVGEVAFQYPLYAGILGIMASTGLMAWVTDRFVDISGPHSFGVIALLSAGLVNIAVPSGGGQFAVQGPVLLETAQELGVDPSIAVMAVAYGDQWTNMIQPFWALPLLAIAGLRIRDILGYTSIVFVVSGISFASTLLVASYIV
ncbi:short-chain fatty acids transporter [Spinactinospora alkalitolerans]|uniref:Short-chain fatty acids transporter n=1 Tax=Spinactinospora alkalitolerans TaxID=687207 RepID=A0A852U3H4_9ACTN|nr:TIGR00366 family protein [Spinactinospora alkalitolerans]NYE50731.1 short-chain fatty acids transporter [Spinactinospora alkalitolerans]